MFQEICRRTRGQLEIDLFVSARNVQLPKFCSRGRDPQVSMMDALSFPWTIQGRFAFPPFSIIPKSVREIGKTGSGSSVSSSVLAKENLVFPCC